MQTRTRKLTKKELILEGERATFRRLITKVYPKGIVSLVSDTYNLWDVLTEIAPSLKQEIEARDGKVVFRPDSGDPVHIVCGYSLRKTSYYKNEILKFSGSDSWLIKNTNDSYDGWETADGFYLTNDCVELSENEAKGCITILDEQFGSSINPMGYRELNPKVGLIYGDSITYERAEAICKRLRDKGFASNNIVFGIGSFTYQYNTRDTFSIACKATYVQVDGEPYNIFKDPVTDDGTKKSACGLLKVDYNEDGKLTLWDQVYPYQEVDGLLATVFENGKLLADQTLEDIRGRVRD